MKGYRVVAVRASKLENAEMKGPSDGQVTSSDDYDEETGRGSEVLLKDSSSGYICGRRRWIAQSRRTVQRRKRRREGGEDSYTGSRDLLQDSLAGSDFGASARAPVAAAAWTGSIRAGGSGHYCWTATGSAAAMDWSAEVESRPVRSRAATRLSVSLRRRCRFRRSSLIMRATRRRCALSWGELEAYRRESQVSSMLARRRSVSELFCACGVGLA